jgi:hypothetical protein
MRYLLMALAVLASAAASALAQESKYYELPKGDYPHDVAVGPSGDVWYAGQNLGIAGRVNPASSEIERISLGKNSAPHGVIVGPDGAPGSPTAARTPLCASIPQRSRSRYGGCPRSACPTPISTLLLSTVGVASGSRARTGSMAGSIRTQAT